MTRNPLAGLLLVAMENLSVAARHLPAVPGGLPLAPWSGGFASEPFPADAAGNPLYDSVEFAGEAGLYAAVDADPQLDVLWTGALAWAGHGIDAVAQDRHTGRYLLCEAKGTQNPIAASPLPYLRATRHKGRQLGWRWCWNSLLDMAEHPASAAAFLRLLEPMLHGGCERLLAISRVERHGAGYRILGSRIYREDELSAYAPLAEVYGLERQRRMWAQLAPQVRRQVAALTGNAPCPQTNRR